MNLRHSEPPKTPILSGNVDADTLYLKNLLIVSGKSQAGIARELGVSKAMINRFVQRTANSDRVLRYFEQLASSHEDKLRGLQVNHKHL